tara:strand:+ start:151 stop:363 length:213 start_codon:yes stop_codon:yes gene_type:complete
MLDHKKNNDGFIHLSKKKQLNKTLKKHFRVEKNLVIIAFMTKKIQDSLKWEVSRNGDLFSTLLRKFGNKS